MEEVNNKLYRLAMSVSDLASEEQVLCAMSERASTKEEIISELMTICQKLSVCTEIYNDLFATVLAGVTDKTEIIVPKRLQ